MWGYMEPRTPIDDHIEVIMIAVCVITAIVTFVVLA